MKRVLLFIALLTAVALSSVTVPSLTTAANSPKKQRAVTRFDQPVKLMAVTLKGEYLFVHDDAAMLRGEACTFVYKGNAEMLDNLVASFHCIPASRNKAASFTMRMVLTEPGQYTLSEFQFEGSKEAHLVPSGQHTEHVATAAMN